MKAKVKASRAEIEVQLTKLDTQFGIQEFTDKDGEKYQFYELGFLPDTTEEVTIDGYVARDKGGGIYLHQSEPVRGTYEWYSVNCPPRQLPIESFPSVTWDSEPKRVRITITPME